MTMISLNLNNIFTLGDNTVDGAIFSITNAQKNNSIEGSLKIKITPVSVKNVYVSL